MAASYYHEYARIRAALWTTAAGAQFICHNHGYQYDKDGGKLTANDRITAVGEGKTGELTDVIGWGLRRAARGQEQRGAQKE